MPTDRFDHLAACHFHESLIGAEPSQLYRPTSRDTEDMTIADLPDPGLLDRGRHGQGVGGADGDLSEGEASEG